MDGQGNFLIFCSRICLILGDQILKILSDFRGPGAHFGGLGAHFEDTSDFLWFWRVFRAKGVVTLEVIFDTFWMQFLVFFWVPSFLDFLWFGVPRGSILGGFLDHFSGRSAKTKKCVWTAQACADCISSFPENALFRKKMRCEKMMQKVLKNGCAS